jgi:Protein of unknown function (DUF3499)
MRGCGRPGCNARAAASVGFDGTRRAVWLHPLDEPEATGRLCSRHADSLQPPQGWRFFDYRQPAATDEVGEGRPPPPAKQPVPALVAGSGIDVDGLLDASTPLLERAFRGARAS